MKKQILAIVALSSLICASFICGVMASNNIKIIVNGKNVEFDVPPQVIDGRTMIPIRAVAEALNCSVDWNEKDNTVIINQNNQSIKQLAANTDDNNKFGIQCDTTVTSEYQGGSKTIIESFKIIKKEKSYSNDEIKITCEFIGVSSGEHCNFNYNCYDNDGFNVDSGSIFTSVSKNTKFKQTKTLFIPTNTVRIELTSYDS